MDTVESIEQGVLTESEVEGIQEEQPRARLANLMQKVIKRRENVRAAQQKLRDIEMELRQAKTEKRSRFERMREGALQEYRNARSEFARARMQLHSSLRMLPSRS